MSFLWEYLFSTFLFVFLTSPSEAEVYSDRGLLKFIFINKYVKCISKDNWWNVYWWIKLFDKSFPFIDYLLTLNRTSFFTNTKSRACQAHCMLNWFIAYFSIIIFMFFLLIYIEIYNNKSILFLLFLCIFYSSSI